MDLIIIHASNEINSGKALGVQFLSRPIFITTFSLKLFVLSHFSKLDSFIFLIQLNLFTIFDIEKQREIKTVDR
jgi:hypothetical protein